MKKPLRLSPLAMTAALAALAALLPSPGRAGGAPHPGPSGPGPAAGSGCRPGLGPAQPAQPSPPTREAPLSQKA